MENSGSFFDNVKIEKVCINGKLIELPIRYYNDKAMVGIFSAPTRRIKQILPTKRFTPVEICPSMSIVSLIGLEHLDTSIGPFNELDIGIPVFLDSKFVLPVISGLSYHRYKSFGVYMARLFVSDERALDAGIQVWNYPKVISDISIIDSKQYRTMIIQKDKEMILKLSLNKKNIESEGKCFNTTFHIYSIKQNQILKSPVNWRGVRNVSRFHRGFSFEFGNHALANELSELRINNLCVESSFYNDLQYILNPPAKKFCL